MSQGRCQNADEERMKKLTQTWKQQKNISGRSKSTKVGSNSILHDGDRNEQVKVNLSEKVTKKRLGRLPISSHNGINSGFKPPQMDAFASGQGADVDNLKSASKNEASFTSSFNDFDAEMLSAMEKMEKDFKVVRGSPSCGSSRTPGLSKHRGSKTPTTPKTKAQLVFDTPKQNDGKRVKVINGQESPVQTVNKKICVKSKDIKQSKIENFTQGENCLNRICENALHTVNTKVTTRKGKENIISNADNENFKSRKASPRIARNTLSSAGVGSSKSCTVQDLNQRRLESKDGDLNVSWSSPSVASTPQVTPGNRKLRKPQVTSAKQTNLFKSLFTLENSLNMSELEGSLKLDNDKPSNTEKVTPESDTVKSKDTKEKKDNKDEDFANITETKSNNSNPGKQSNVNSINGEPKDSVKETMDKSKSSEIHNGDERLELSNWGLPETVLKQYHDKGINTMFSWQAECLCIAEGKVLAGGNLVYSAPTSAGKTMVAELLVLKRVMETKRKAIIILPFVSVAREKMFYLQQMYQDAGVRVGGFMGSYSPAGGFSGIDVAVCTIEKGNSLINRLLEENRLGELGIIVVDELHLVGDSHRGYLLELLLTKVIYVMKKEEQKIKGKDREQLDVPDHNVQVVGMSATLPNLDLLAKWLNAELYHTDFRPVPLTECVKIGTSVYDSSLVKIRDVDLTLTFKNDEDHVIPLCLEMLRNGHSTLIFCPTKNWCEKLCETVARELYGLLRLTGLKLTDIQQKPENDVALEIARSLPLNRQVLLDVVEQLRRTPVGLDSMLGKTIPYGVAFHHAGLTFDERDIVEGAFRQGILKVLVATSTLSSGVNLPARRVIVRSPTFHGKIVDFLTYKQMIGRAGRKGVDTEGESVLICKLNERAKAVTLVTSELPPVGSCLHHKEGEPLSRSLKRAILEIVVSGVASVPEDVAMYASCTMLAASLPEDTNQTDALINSCLKFLRENEFVSLQKVKDSDGSEVERFCPTQLGSAVLASALSPDEGLTVFAELEKARQCFVLENELHIIYLVTPIYGMDLGGEMDWYQFYYQWEKLTPGQRRVAELVGVSEGFITKAIRGRIPTKTYTQMRTLAIHKRFWTALMLHDLVQEMPLNNVARKYNCNKGQLQSLQQSSATFAGMVTVFCRRLGWCNLELILGQFQNRLTFGIQRELCDLVRLTLLNGQRARVLYNGGFQTVAALANANPCDVEAIFKNASPFESNKRQENESEWEANQRRESRCMWLTGRKGVTELEAALAVIEEAKGLIQDELGGLGIQWKNSESDETKDDSVKDTGDTSSNGDKTTICASQAQNKSTLSSRSVLIGSVKRSGSALMKKSGKRLSGRKSTSPSVISVVTSPEERRSKRGGSEECVVVSPPNMRIKQQGSSKKKIHTNVCVTHNQEGREMERNVSVLKERSYGIQDTELKEHLEEKKTALIKSKAKSSHEISDSSKAEVHTVVADVHLPVPKNVHKPECENTHASLGSGDHKQDIDVHTCSVQTSVHKPVQRDILKPENCVHTEDIFGDSLDEQMDMTLENVGVSISKKNEENDSAKSKCDSGIDRNCDNSEVNAQVKKVPVFRIDSQLNDTLDICDMSCDIVDCDADLRLEKPNEKMMESKDQNSKCDLNLESRKVDTDVRLGKPCERSESKGHNTISDLNSSTAPAEVSVSSQNGCKSLKENLTLEDFTDSFMMDTQIDKAVSEINLPTSPPLYSEDMVTKSTSTEKAKTIENLYVDEVKESHDISHDASGDLLAASNYERCAFHEEGNYNDSDAERFADDSYKDLHIPYQSGQEACFHDNTKLPENVDEKGADNKDHDDLVIALEMDDTFSCTVKSQNDKEKKMSVKNLEEKNSACSNTEAMEDSITMSMVEKVLDISPVQDKDLKETEKETIACNSKTFTSVKKKPNVVSECSTVGKDNVQTHNRLSPGTVAFLDSLHTSSHMSPIKPPPKARKSSEQMKTDHNVQGKSENSKNKRKRKSDELKDTVNIPEVAKQRKSDEGLDQHDVSGGSDCLPPTPPAEKSCNSPLLSFKRMTPNRGKSCSSKTLNSTKKNAKLNSTVKIKKIPASKEQMLTKDPVFSKVTTDGPRLAGNDKDDVEQTDSDRVPCIDPNESNIPSTQETFAIIDVCADKRLFDTFIKEWKTKNLYSISLACEKKPSEPAAGGGIGSNFLRNSASKPTSSSTHNGIEVEGMDLLIVGLAVCWENRDSYYVALNPDNPDSDLDDSLSPPPLDKSIPVSHRMSEVQTVLEQGLSSNDKVITIRMFDCKKMYTALVRGCGIAMRGRFQDPKVACWLQDPGANEKNLHRMVHNYLPTEAPMLHDIGGGIGVGSLGMTPQNPGSGRYRATTEAVLTLHLMDYFTQCLQKEDLMAAFQKVEMPSVVTLARMELNGFGFSEPECESQKDVMLARLSALEEEAYRVAGHPFSLTATDDIAQVLFIEMQLPPDGNPNSLGQPHRLGNRGGPARGKGRQKSQFSTSKDILEKLKPLNPLPGIILEWRRISNALTKVVFPLQKERVFVPHLDMYRIFTECQVHTATGRVSLTEPNLQNIPKDFEIALPDIIGESPPPNLVTPQRNSKSRAGNSKLRQLMGINKQISRQSEDSKTQSFAVSMRHAFVPFKGGVMLAADYSQLELRMIAHLSQDKKLINILNADGDVFKLIAAQWKSTSPEDIGPQQRQQAKQICYGMIYGIGAKALGEQLEVEENDAAAFIETFKSKYPGMRSYLRDTVTFCKENGYVQTILGRRRYLSTITSRNPYVRAHAERQAVNTTVQGSAADLVKTAMNNIDVKLSDEFPLCSYPHKHRLGRDDLKNTSLHNCPRGCYLVLQLHDELIYEVTEEDMLKAAHIIKHEMENAMKFSVKMPVKIQVGPSWGKLQEIQL